MLNHVTLSPADTTWARRMAGIPASVTYGMRTFPAPGDYRQRINQWATEPDAPTYSRLCVLAQRDWHVRGQTGCQFARLAARAASILRWDYLVLDGTMSPTADLAAAGHAVTVVAADPHVEVVSILAPAATTTADAVALVERLVALSQFWLERNETVDGYRRLHLRYPVRPGVQAWVMAFAPFDFLPNTRRSPYLELAIRVKPKPDWIFHRLTQDRDVAHLADVPLTMTDLHWEDRWQSTLRRTRMILGGEPDDISAAKATLAVPANELT